MLGDVLIWDGALKRILRVEEFSELMVHDSWFVLSEKMIQLGEEENITLNFLSNSLILCFLIHGSVYIN